MMKVTVLCIPIGGTCGEVLKTWRSKFELFIPNAYENDFGIVYTEHLLEEFRGLSVVGVRGLLGRTGVSN